MKNADPIEVAITAAWITAEALLTALVAAVALVVLVARPAPASVEAPPPLIAATEHPLSLVAVEAQTQLQPCTVAALRRLARAAGLPRTLTRSGRRAELLQALAAWEVVLV